jgi:multiple sugar transport system ATP-binding protein
LSYIRHKTGGIKAGPTTWEGTLAALDIVGVTKAFGPIKVLHGIDIAVADGEFLVLVGPSGCGKSTLLRMIAGLESVTGGELKIGGTVVNDVPPRGRDIAMVFQDYALYPHKSVRDNIGFGLRMRNFAADEISKRVDDAAKVLQIGHLLDRKPGQLSGGQRQRVAMGRAIVRDPKVFLFDEPLSNLDAQLRAEMRVEIKKLHQRFKNTVVYVTHDQVEAMTLADRIAVMKGGNVEQLGTPDDIYNQPRTTFVAGFTGSPPMNFAPCDVAADGAAIVLEGGVRLPVPKDRRAAAKAAAGKRMTFGIRPEHITLDGGPGEVPAEVVLTEPLGSDTLALLRLGKAEITGRFPPDSGLKAGLKRSVTLAMSKFHLFDPDTGIAVR